MADPLVDLETMLRESFEAAADRAPAGTGLAEVGRRRARRRRTAWAVGTCVAAVVTVTASVVWTDSTPRPPRQDQPLAGATDSTSAGLPGWRVETWRDLTVTVPDAWGYGSLDQWCVAAEGGDASGTLPVVQRPEGASTLVGCTPGLGYGLRFVDPGDPTYPASKVWRPMDPERYPEGSWVGYRRAGPGEHADVLVVGASVGLVEQVLDSAERVDEDPNGCWTTAEARDGNGAGPADRPGAVCRYGPDGWLQQSEALTADQAERALAAVQAAPPASGQSPCPAIPQRWSSVVLRFGPGPLGDVRVVWESDCPSDNGVFLAGTARGLTADVLYWALSPGWSGGVSGDVPMPDRLRR